MRPDGAEAEPDGGINVFADAGPEWMRPSQLATFDKFSNNLVVYGKMTNSSMDGCELWSGPTIEHIYCDVLDDRCPTLAIIHWLKRRGWKEGPGGRVVHTDATPALFDCQEAIKFKAYYQVLVKLPKCIPLASSIPSRECVGFYRLLLRGLQAEPGQSAKTYQLALNDDLKKRGKIIEPLPSEEVGPLPLPDPDGIMLAGPPLQPPLPQPKSTPSGPRTGRAAAGRGGRGRGQGGRRQGGPGPGGASRTIADRGRPAKRQWTTSAPNPRS